MRLPGAAMLLAVALAACSSVSATLPYKPEVQPPGAFISAAYTIVSDRLRVEIDTGGRRLERAQIVKPEGGGVLEAQTIEYATPPSAGSPVGIGFGGFGMMGRGVGTGVGVSTGTTMGGGPVSATTIASFPIAQAGPSPWRVRVTLQDAGSADILVGEPAGR